MKPILRSYFYRLFREKAFYIELGILFGLSLIIAALVRGVAYANGENIGFERAVITAFTGGQIMSNGSIPWLNVFFFVIFGAVRYRKDMRHLRILVRVCGDHDGHLKRIAEHYNRLWAAECCSEGGHQHQHTITKTEHLNAPITCFGSLSGVFTWDSVVGDTINREARAFMEKYEESIRNLKGAAGEKTESWDEQQRRLMQLNDDEYPGYSPTLTGITKLRRMQRQNMENCFHKLTKQQLAALALGDDRAALLTSHVLSREVNQTTYLWQESSPDQAVTRVLDVIAQTEHLRWVASHEILGYRDHGDVDYKNEVRMLHGCLKPWQELSTRVKSYDYNIVDVSLGII